MKIRSYTAADANAVATLFHRAVREIGARDYSQAQIEAWSAAPVPERLNARLTDGRLALVADNNGTILAFGDLEADGHIDFLYAAPEAAGKGITAQLYAALETSAREQSITRLYTEASEAARRFFLKQGFIVQHRRDFDVNGVPIHNYAMEKAL